MQRNCLTICAELENIGHDVRIEIKIINVIGFLENFKKERKKRRYETEVMIQIAIGKVKNFDKNQ